MKITISICKNPKYIFIFFILLCCTSHTKINESITENTLMDELLVIGQSELCLIQYFCNKSDKNEKITKNDIILYKDIAIKYDSCVFMLNDLLINDTIKISNINKNKRDKVIAVSKLISQYVESLRGSKSFNSTRQYGDIDYVFQMLLKRPCIALYSTNFDKKLSGENQQLWGNIIILLRVEHYLRESTMKECRSIDLFEYEISFFMKKNVELISMYSDLEEKEQQSHAQKIKKSSDLYSFIRKTLLSQYANIYSQLIIMDSNDKNHHNSGQLIKICEDFFRETNNADYIIEPRNKSRYINALETSGRAIYPTH